MENTDVRKLRLFEFNRTLSYISEIIEIERKKKQLDDQKDSLEYELYDWRQEEDLTEEEREVVGEAISEIRTKLPNIASEIEELEEYEKALKKLVTKTIEAVTEERYLRLEKSEIRQDMLEEYIYLLCEIEIENNYMEIGDIFDEVADFVVLLVEMYGEDATNLISDILLDRIGNFNDYFN